MKKRLDKRVYLENFKLLFNKKYSNKLQLKINIINSFLKKIVSIGR